MGGQQLPAFQISRACQWQQRTYACTRRPSDPATPTPPRYLQDELRDALLLVFANKQDLPNAMNAAEITDKLGLHSLRQRQWCVPAARTPVHLLWAAHSVGALLYGQPRAGWSRQACELAPKMVALASFT